MSTQADLEIFEKMVAARGRILRVEADRVGATVGVLAMTFDLGRIVLSPGESGLRVGQASDRSELPRELESLDEEDPWWRLLGHPLTAAWPGGVEDGVGARGLGDLMILKLRFREESENPRVIAIEAVGRGIRVRLEAL